jgi:hypothetical protein
LFRIYAAIHADSNIIVFIGTLAMNPERIDALGERIVIGEDDAAVTVTAKWLRRKKTCCRQLGNLPHPPAAILRAETLRCIG